MHGAGIRQPCRSNGFINAIDLAVRDDGSWPGLVVTRIVLDQDELPRMLDRPTVTDQVDAAVVTGKLGRALEIIGRPRSPDDEEIAARGATGMRHFAHPVSVRARCSRRTGRRVVVGMGERSHRLISDGNIREAERTGHAARASLPIGLSDGWLFEGRVKGRNRPRCRKAKGSAEAVVVQVVVVDDHDVAGGQLSLEMKRLRSMEGTDQRLPVATVGKNRPQPPEALVA